MRRYLRLTEEATWGTFDGAATTTKIILVDLDQANSYTVRPKPVTVDTRTAGSGNTRLKKTSKKKMLAGNLNMLIRGSQAVTLASWITPAAGSTAHKSFTADYVIEMEDTTKVYSRHLGMMIQQAQIQSSEQSTLARLSLQVVGKTTATITVTDFAEPAATDFASDAFLCHEDLSGHFSIATSRTEFESFGLTVKNLLDVRFFESSSPTRIKYCGRDVDWTSKLAYKIATDRSDYEALTAVSGSATYDNGVNTLVMSMNSENFFDDVEDDLDDSKVFLQQLNMQAFFDSAAGTPGDFAITAT